MLKLLHLYNILMLAIIVFCICAIIAYTRFSKKECTLDTDCSASYKCQSGKCTAPAEQPPCTSGNCILCNSDNCPLPNTCQNNKCVSPCSLTNCPSPKICDENKKCITRICTPEQIAKIFPPDTYDYRSYGPCTGTSDDKYLSFDKTYSSLNTNRTDIPNINADDCKLACDKNPSCTAWIHDNIYGRVGCQLSTSIIDPPDSGLNVLMGYDGRDLILFRYNQHPESVYSTNVKLSAIV